MTRTPAHPAELSKAYQPAEHESRIWQRWIDANAFRADPARVLAGEAPPYCVLIPPPNVTGALHLGHALNNTLQDVLVRSHRMKGFETLWMPGTDHAGIATQTVVDKRLRDAGEPALAEHKRMEAAGEPGRERFVEKVMAWKDEYEARITGQLQEMGCSCDWDRQRFTMDDLCARAVREAFFRLFRDGLIYRGKRLVNWDPVTQTALADDEVENIEVDGHFFYLRYPLVHESEPGDHRPVTWGELQAKGYPGADAEPEDDEAWVTIATTRPETYLGDVAVAVNPRDPRAEAVRGLNVELPLVGRVIPVIEDEYVVLPVRHGGPEGDPKAEYATGFLKVTPGHDPNDWEIGLRHGLPAINVMAPDASISKDHGWLDWESLGRNPGCEVFLGLSRDAARKKVVEEFQARSLNHTHKLLEDIRPYRHSVGHSYRSHAAIEYYLSDQWYCAVTDDRLRGAAQRALRAEQRSAASLEAWLESAPRPGGGDDSMTFFPTRYARNYETWHDNLRDWCISRQLWWGHRIPVWHRRMTIERGDHPNAGEFGALGLDHLVRGDDEHGAIRIHDELGQEIDPREFLRADAMRARAVDVYVCYDGREPKDAERLEAAGFTQDPDVLDTWFSSALWPLSTLGWPDPEQSARDTGDPSTADLLRSFNPTSVLCTAREIITLWVSRMVMFNRYFLAAAEAHGPPPFRDVFIHAMIQDGEGRKMSKSLGNGVDPKDIIESHGADAMRFTLVEMTTQTQDVRMPVEPDPRTGKNTSPKFDLGRNFCNKLWNAARFALAKLPAEPPAAIDPGELFLADRWMLARLREGTAEIDRALTNYEFSSYAKALYDVVRRDFCDWYLEAVKPTIADRPAQQGCLRLVLDALLRLVHPVAPFITETIFERLREIPSPSLPGVTLTPPGAGDLLATAGWPVVEASLADPEAVARFERVRTIVDGIRSVRSQQQVEPRRRIVLHATGPLAEEIAASGGLVESLAGLRAVTTEPPTGPSSALTFDGVEQRLSDLADALDARAERERLTRELGELERSIAALEKRLSNPGYVDKAPAHLVDQTRAELEQTKADRETVAAALERIG